MNAEKDNPLLSWTELPPFDRIEIEHIEPAINALLERSEKALSELESSSPTTWTALMEPMERFDDDLGRVWGVVSHLHAVKNSPALREVYEPLLGKVVAFSDRIGQSKALYQAFCTLRNCKEWDGYDTAQRRILEACIRDAELNGVGLDDQDRTRYNEISQRMAELTTRFSNNVLDATKSFSLTLKSSEDIEGLPPTLLELAADEAQRTGHEKASAETGPWVITLDYPSFMPFMQHSRHRELREQLYRAYVTRASSGDYDNMPLIQELLALRRERARLLGFDTFAELSLSRKMAQNVDNVEALLIELRKAARPMAEKDLDELRNLAREAGAPEADEMRHWDTAFWAERLQEARYEIHDEELRPYFPLSHVLKGLFELSEKLFDIRVKPAYGEAPVWHEDVHFFKVYDQDDTHIASFYLDAYSRPGEKRGGAWMNVAVGRSAVMAPPGEKVRLPVAYLMCNQGKPVGGKPSLMTFHEVETLFHEFGHALQHMLTTVDYGMAAGIANIEWDAVELPSHFMENWCYHPPTLKSLAHHYKTGESLPDDIIDRIRSTRTFREGSNTVRQVNFGLYDMEIHHRYLPEGPETPLDVQQRIDRETLVMPPLPEDRFLCAFSHIFSGGYSAGYYSYKWSEVLSADAFSSFQEAGLDNAESVHRLGRRFRDTVLALGGSVHPMDVFRAFRGREPTTDALLKQAGLKS